MSEQQAVNKYQVAWEKLERVIELNIKEPLNDKIDIVTLLQIQFVMHVIEEIKIKE